jgi:uncharacterized membrane protein YhaH (DUF805 family)
VAAAVVAKGAELPLLAGAYLLAYLLLRVATAWVAARGLHDRRVAGKLWLLPLRDAIMSIVWVAGLLSDRIRWRGSEFRVKNGLLRPVGTGAPKN